MFTKPLVASLVLISFHSFSGGWVSDWVDSNGTGTGASTYKGGNRSYLSAGNISLRSNSTVDYPFTVSAPRVETSGCGIDLFGGGLSYMDADYLVEKFEGIIQNAEVVAFQLGIQALSDKLGGIITDMEDLTNFINGMQLDECAIAKGAVTTIVDGGSMSDAGNAVWKEISQEQTLDLGIFKNSTDSNESNESNGGTVDSSVDVYQEIAACPAPVRNLFKVGSVIENITDMYGLSSYEDFIRGYVGDVIITTPSGSKLPIGIPKGACDDNSPEDIVDFINGTSKKAAKPSSSNPTAPLVCSNASDISLIDYSEDKLVELVAIIKNPNGNLEANVSLYNFVTNAPMPVYELLKNAIAGGVEIAVIQDLKTTLAYAYSYHIFNDLYRNVQNALIKGKEAKLASSGDDDARDDALTANPSASKPKCNLKGFLIIDEQIDKLEKRLKEVKTASQSSFLIQLTETKLLNDRIEKMNIKNRIEANKLLMVE